MDKNRQTLHRLGSGAWKACVYALLIFWALMVLFPFYWMLLTSV